MLGYYSLAKRTFTEKNGGQDSRLVMSGNMCAPSQEFPSFPFILLQVALAVTARSFCNRRTIHSVPAQCCHQCQINHMEVGQYKARAFSEQCIS